MRCPWCGHDPLYVRYHDDEWGVPSRDDLHLFEMLLLEGAQAGLSWITILRKRENYRAAFAGFDPERIARFGRRDVERLLADPGIVRNRAKILSAIGNARAFVALAERRGSFGDWLWSFVGGKPIVRRPRTMAGVPATTPLSERIGKELKLAGFTFVGGTIVYSFLQAVGVVDDHLARCWRARPRSARPRLRSGESRPPGPPAPLGP
ncbi:MAG: DNA-3-methyladenine glycosylase I [Planctomycetota bacterium]